MMSTIRKFTITVLGLAGMFLSTQAAALMIDFSCITNNNANDCAIGEQQLKANLSNLGNNQVEFRFYNFSGYASSIEGVYFDDGTLFGISSLIDADEGVGGMAGVDFTAGSASPSNLPGANLISPEFQTTSGFLADSNPPTSLNGVNPGEWLAIIFDLQPGRVFDDVITDLATGDLRIGLHAIAFDSGGSESFVNTPVPLPAAAWLFLAGLTGLGVVSRRKNSN